MSCNSCKNSESNKCKISSVRCSVDKKRCDEKKKQRTEIVPRDPPLSNCPVRKFTTLLNLDFASMTIEQVNDLFTHQLPGLPPFADDGTSTITSEGLFVNAPQFTFTTPTGNEHPKNLRYFKQPFKLSDKYETYYEVVISADQYIPIDNIPPQFASRIRDVYEDIRLCSAAINTIDINTFIVTDIFLARDKIFFFAERLPFGKTPENDYAAYSSAYVSTSSGRGTDGNGSLSDFVNVGIGLTKRSARYYINDELVFELPRFGVRQDDSLRMLDHQGSSEQVIMEQSYFGFGLFSLLDMQLPNNYARQLVDNDFGNNAFPPSDPRASGNQAASGLVQLEPEAGYGETLPGKYNGDNRPIIDPTVTWAYPYIAPTPENPDPNLDVKLFGQGAGMILKKFKVYRRCLD